MITKCTHENLKCIDSRKDPGKDRRRRQECLDCGHRFTTLETEVTEEKTTTRKMMRLLKRDLGLNTKQAEAIANLIDSFLTNGSRHPN